MPLYEADPSVDRYRVPGQFVIFYSSITTEDGQMWCAVDTPDITFNSAGR